MGVDFYACSCCGESRYSEYVGSCTGCGNRLCTNCLENDDIGSQYAYDYGVIFDGSKEMMDEYGITQDEIEKGYFVVGMLIDDTSIQPKYCPYCEGSTIDESDFVEFLIEKLGKTREELEKEYIKLK